MDPVRRACFRQRGILFLALLGLLVAALSVSTGVAYADPWASEPPPEETWFATQADTVLRAAPTLNSERLSVVRAGTALRALGRGAQWLQVYDPRTDVEAFVRRDLLTPAAEPSPFLYEEPPPLDTETNAIGVLTSDQPLYVYPSRNEAAQTIVLNASKRESIIGSVEGDDGEPWYRTADGYYLPGDELFLSSEPENFAGRWLDVKLSGATRVVAYENGAPVRSFGAIKGTTRWPTPLGVWSIVRRVANETMDSATIGIPRAAPGGYYLKDVLYTQYFRETGESLHYNYWSSAWGTAGSHGCLGLSLADSRWLWEWAAVGTPVVIHP